MSIKIPDMLLRCIKNERELGFEKINRRVFVKGIKKYYSTATPEQRAEHKRKQSEYKKKYYANLSQKKKDEINKKISETIKKKYATYSNEKLKNMIKPALKELYKIYADPEKKKERFKKIGFYNQSIVEKDLPRVNDYSGVVTLSDLESLK